VHQRLLQRYPELASNDGFFRDMVSCAVGTVWQTSILLLPLFFILRQHAALAWALAVVVITSFVLKRCWYDRLEPGPGYLREGMPQR
jgi:hypothetical protein